MKLLQKLAKPIQDTDLLLGILAVLAVSGTAQMLLGGFWDAASHAIKAPETFWSIQHVAVYFGVALTAVSAVLGGLLLYYKRSPKNLVTPIKILIAGSVLQLVSGYADSVSHDIFGIDGLISWSHQPLELGLVLASIGAFLILKHQEPRFAKFLPLTIMVLILSVAWISFSIALYFAGIVLCAPVYEIFSSGCAIL